MNETVFRIFQLASSKYCCTQIMLKIQLEQEGIENTDLIKAVGGLCGGVGFSGGICGVLTGGICIIGLYSGKGREEEYNKEDFYEMIEEYINWFDAEYKSRECMDIIGSQLKKNNMKEPSYPVKCGEIIEKGLSKAWEIINKHGYELGARE
ncbi:DVU_1555 family C-GCAxxG-C-C protein [Maledivibacter halophilus]|uniref:C_GCAxxG_C_C family probable redox protein n=1 Tax=Maledivibacter halophilus TaxID=36842 RepID=A0A1T5J5H0_9FIRM|nr:DV_1555 family C-GCAxxG-C-C protein [Maledivibacter halophilus]SKC46644.1 C_GCAxxG_C_C family probable redox protein [Maledivibacter halophilus]